MYIHRVTITGADDGVDPNELAALSKVYPFVEWGILHSKTRQGLEPRYPAAKWMKQLTTLTKTTPMNLSAHLCGQHARDVLSGNFSWFLPEDAVHYQRVQLNGWKPGNNAWVEIAQVRPKTEFILQIPGEDNILEAVLLARENPNVSGLYDVSGGRGITPDHWPEPPVGFKLGYAGGLKLENVEYVVEDTMVIPGQEPFWVDMESGVRSNEGREFDLKKVREVLHFLAPYFSDAFQLGYPK